MKILVTGGTGFIGKALCRALVDQGHEILVISRKKRINIDGISFLLPSDEIPHIDGVINMAGENIAGGLWSRRRKEMIYHSRVSFTEDLVETLNDRKLSFFIQFSATGFYSDSDRVQNETGDKGGGFLSNVCQAWEVSSQPIISDRRVVLRVGTVLGRNGGYLAKILPMFKFFMGGFWGRANSYFSWIHLKDLIQIICHAVSSDMNGIYNAVAPNPVTKKEFSDRLAHSIHRFAVINLPSFLLIMIFGELATLFLKSERVVPSRLIDEKDYDFLFPTIDSVFSDLL